VTVVLSPRLILFRHHVRLEISRHALAGTLKFWDFFRQVSFGDGNQFASSQAGLVNNLNDGMSLGISPCSSMRSTLAAEQIGILKAVYSTVWGVVQTVIGPLSIRCGRKGLIVAGMWVQADAATRSFGWRFVASVL
jgi:hypothetical protein